MPDPAPPVVVTVRCRRYGRRDLAQLGLRISVIIAALKEERNLPYVFARLPDGLHEVIIVDGHSKDRTVAVARATRPDGRIRTQTGRVKGTALAEGFAFSNAGDTPAHVRVEVRPALRIEELCETSLADESRVMSSEMPKRLELVLFVREYAR